MCKKSGLIKCNNSSLAMDGNLMLLFLECLPNSFANHFQPNSSTSFILRHAMWWSHQRKGSSTIDPSLRPDRQEEGGIWRRSPTENTPKHYSAIHSSILLHSSESLMRINTNIPPTLSSSKVSDKLLLLLVRGIELKGLKITTKSDSTDFM